MSVFLSECPHVCTCIVCMCVCTVCICACMCVGKQAIPYAIATCAHIYSLSVAKLCLCEVYASMPFSVSLSSELHKDKTH